MMSRSRTRSTRSAARLGALVCSAGLAVTLTSPTDSMAIKEARRFIGIKAWEDIGVTGAGVTVGNMEGLPPQLEHKALARSGVVPIVYDNDNNFAGGFRRTSAIPSAHATATAGAMVSNDKAALGIAPKAQLLSGWFAVTLDQDGFYSDGDFNYAPGGGGILDPYTWTLFAMTDPDYAADAAALMNIPQYQTATVVNLSVGATSVISKRGEDEFSRICDAVAVMTNATLVAPCGDDGAIPEPQDPAAQDQGSVYSPASAYNVLAVGALERDFDNVADFSGQGPIKVYNHGFGIYPQDDPLFVPPFEQVIPPVGAGGDAFGRAGPDVVAPGAFLLLPGSAIASPFDDSAFSEFWEGSSFASAITAGAVALVHEAGLRLGMSIDSTVTRAVIMNSAEKEESGFDNAAQQEDGSEDQELVTMEGLDEELGAGVLDLRRLRAQYLFAADGARDYSGLPGFMFGGGGNFQGDINPYAMPASGPDPGLPFVTRQRNTPPCLQAFGGPPAASLTPGLRPTAPGEFGPAPMEGVVRNPFDQAMRPCGLDRPDPDLGNGRPPSGGGNNNGEGTTPPATGTPGAGGGGGATGIRPFRSGWDHGNIGEGEIDLPIGVLTQGSAVSITLTWNRNERWRLRPVSDVNVVNFPSGDNSAGTPDIMALFEFEDLDLELWRRNFDGSGNRLVAASRTEWTNTECIYIEPGDANESDPTAPLGTAPAEYFIRIRFMRTLYDWSGFYICGGGEEGSFTQIDRVPAPIGELEYDDTRRAEVEYGLAWYADMTLVGGLRAFLNPDTGEVEIPINDLAAGFGGGLDEGFRAAVGDVNLDYGVDQADVSLILPHIGSTNRPDLDVNGDGIVDARDVAIVFSNLYTTAQPGKNALKKPAKLPKFKNFIKNKKISKQVKKEMQAEGALAVRKD